ncbi:hypothetical protein AF335_25760 [Streptomyces eurocidicus]|uniref:DUF4245 domain-containing protein n=1 Tax=Streptomyces eurocidicus TaxID=66423 RepID=A0A2N8NRV6_STREU|nr:DUF4245 domain-containing protein [Streptomyces eurocidicus]MBB5117245.1 hypothetical protein [Streptomyces eurocidicus]MBF6052465.1 DUF4245 family protein [Streptomyces eurocidicus]PNE31507.1 hypothetical protein AF335_25760 [Streptomyces eurocidicus]
MAARSGKAQTVRNMVLSLAVVIPVAFVSYAFLPHDESNDPVKTVGYRVELDTARRAAPYAVAAPEGLAEGWRATSVSYRAGGKDGSTWHLGFLDPQKEYVAVEQSDGPAAEFIDEVSRRAERTDSTQKVGDTSWRRYAGEKYNALVREERGVTTVVTGTAPFGRLAEMAAALKAEKKDLPEGAGKS